MTGDVMKLTLTCDVSKRDVSVVGCVDGIL